MRQILVIVGLLTGFLLVGAIGFRLTEGWDWLQCVSEAVIIMTTVGLSATTQAELKSSLREKGVMVVGIRRANGERLMPPPGTAVIAAGDCLFAFGNSQAVGEMIGRNGSSE